MDPYWLGHDDTEVWKTFGSRSPDPGVEVVKEMFKGWIGALNQMGIDEVLADVTLSDFEYRRRKR